MLSPAGACGEGVAGAALGARLTLRVGTHSGRVAHGGRGRQFALSLPPSPPLPTHNPSYLNDAASVTQLGCGVRRTPAARAASQMTDGVYGVNTAPDATAPASWSWSSPEAGGGGGFEGSAMFLAGVCVGGGD